MCRLFGYRSLEPAGVQHELLEAANALRVQSHEHPDGWGLGWYRDGEPRVVRGLDAAHGDEDFATAARSLSSATLVAHIRKASVGRVSIENTHPFEWGPWLFLHNGTVPQWETAGPAIERLIDRTLRRNLQGETDSERCFLLFISRLMARCDPTQASFGAAADALSETVAAVQAASEPGADKASSTTFLATDGKLMLACRRNRTLFMEAPAVSPSGSVARLSIASEQPCRCNGRTFREVPEGTIVGVDGEMRLHQRQLNATSCAA